ncbi:MAG: hypothetical protein ABSF61_08675 [Anaerolineales bacterium]|jgi:ferredoxin
MNAMDGHRLSPPQEAVVQAAVTCLHCRPPAPCTLACPQEAWIEGVMRFVAEAACGERPLRYWFRGLEVASVAEIEEWICEAYR